MSIIIWLNPAKYIIFIYIILSNHHLQGDLSTKGRAELEMGQQRERSGVWSERVVWRI